MTLAIDEVPEMKPWTDILVLLAGLLASGAFIGGCVSDNGGIETPRERGEVAVANDASWIIQADPVGEQDKPLPSFRFVSTRDETASSSLQNAHSWLIRVPEQSMSDLVDEIGKLPRHTRGSDVASDLPEATYGTYRFRIWEKGTLALDYVGPMSYSRQVFTVTVNLLHPWAEAGGPIEAVLRRLQG